MEDLLNYIDLFDPLENEGTKPDEVTNQVWKKMHKKTIGQIRQWIKHSVFYHVVQETDAYAIWKKLEDMYQAKAA